MLIGADNFLGMVSSYRMCWFEGRYGGGKTSLAVRVAYELLKRGKVRYCISNIPIVFRDDPAKVELRDGKRADCVVVLDEAGIYLDTGRDARAFLAFLRKMNIILLMPSVLDVARVLQTFSVQRTVTWNSIGIPLWMYNAKLRSGRQRDSYNFGWWNPSEIFDIYDTEAAPDDDAGLHTYVQEWTRQLQAAAKVKISYRRTDDDSSAFTPHDAFSDLSGQALPRSSPVLEGQVQSKLSAVADGGWDSRALEEAAEKMDKAVSLYDELRDKRKS